MDLILWYCTNMSPALETLQSKADQQNKDKMLETVLIEKMWGLLRVRMEGRLLQESGLKEGCETVEKGS